MVREANEYDQLLSHPAWQRVMGIIEERVGREITEATHSELDLEPEKQRLKVLRWNAMREVMDTVLNTIKTIRADRDRINKEDEEWQKMQELQLRSQ